jgi:hypothetical protein
LAFARGFLSTFENLKNQQKVSQSALILPNCCNSVIAKLRIAEKHLNGLLSFKEWVFPTGSSSNATATSGNTIAPTFPATSPETEVTGELDDFFIDLKSSFEMFGQVMNLVYFDQPLNEDDVNFFSMVMLMRIQKSNSLLMAHLNSILNAQWFEDLKDFRERAYHQRNILWEISMKHSNAQATVYPQVVEISIQDNPNSPTFAQNKNVRNFCLPLLQSSFSAIDKSFEIIDREVKNADRIPV